MSRISPLLRLAVLAWLAGFSGVRGQGVAMPRMASGAEELGWVDRQFPENGDPEARKRALERVIDDFGDDSDTVFRAEVRLALLDWNGGHPLAAHDRLRGLQSSHFRGIDRDKRAWAQILDGQTLADLNRLPEAVDRLDRVVEDSRLSIERRSMAAIALAEAIMPQAPKDALATLEEIAAVPGGDTANIESEIAHVLLFIEHRSELVRRLSDRVEAGGGESALIALLRSSSGWKLPGDAARLDELAGAAEQARPIPSEPLRSAIEAVRAESASRRIEGAFTSLLASAPFAPWYKPAASDRFIRLAGFEAAIAEAERRTDPVACLEYSLRDLSSHGDDGDFPRRLWQAAGYADWIERMGRPSIDPGVCSGLLELCDRLPPGSPYFWEGKFLRAKRLDRAGDRRAAQAVLREIIARTDLPIRYLEPACRALGASLEATGDFGGALEVYRTAEPAAGAFGSGADCLLHALLVNLHLGQDAEAVRLAHELENLPEDTVKASTAPGQIQEIAALARTGRAGEVWAPARVWWPDWVKFGQEVGVNAAIDRTSVPEIADMGGLAASVRQAWQEKDRPTFFERFLILASAARWLPSLGPEVASFEAEAAHFAPERRDEIRKLTIELLDSPHPAEIPGWRERQLYLATDDFNAKAAGDALRVAGEFFSAAQPADAITRAMQRVRALAALAAGQDYAASAAGLERILADSSADDQRAMTVGLLADLYHRLNRDGDANDLVRHELDNAVVRADAAGSAGLADRLKKSLAVPAAEDAMVRWVEAAQIPWLAYAEPKDLADPRLRNGEDVLQEADKVFPPIERIKVRLLAAQDRHLPLGLRQRAFRQAVRQLLAAAPTYSAIDRIAQSVVDNGGFDAETRVEILWTVLAMLSEDGRTADYGVWRANPMCGRLTAEFQARLAVLDREASVDRTSRTAIVDAVDALTAGELSSYGALAVQDLFGFLLRLGALSDAERMADRASTWPFAAGTQPDRNALQLDFDRRLRRAKSWNGVHDALAASVLARYPTARETLPAGYQDLRLGSQLPVRAPEETFQAARYLMQHRQFNRDDLAFWETVVSALPRNPDTAGLVGDLLHAGLGAAQDDEQRSELIVLFFSSADADDAQVRAALEREFVPYRDPIKEPQSSLVVRLYEIHRDLRLGAPVSLQTALADAHDPRAELALQRAALRTYTVEGDRTSLQHTLDRIDAGRLLSPGFLPRAIDAFGFLGMDRELKTAREVARNYLRQAVLNSWALRDESLADTALDLAEALGDPRALPAAWVSELGTGPGNPRFQERIRLVQAYLNADWTRLEATAAALNRDYPTAYSFYWFRGLALAKLGRAAESVPALATFVRYAKDDRNYPEAVRLLAARARATGHPG